MIIKNSEAFEKGIAAYYDGRYFFDNPFSFPYIKEKHDWEDGWNYAFKVAEFVHVQKNSLTTGQ